MVKPLKFRDAVLARVSPPEILLAKLEEALRTTHRITAAGDASKIPLPGVMKHVVDTLSAIVKAEVRPHMIELFDRHIDAVSDEYELDEGGSDGLSAAEAETWWGGLLKAQFESFAGEVRGVVSDEAVMAFVAADEPTEVLVDAILLKPIDDTGAMKIKLGITPDQLQPLMRGVHTNWAAEPVDQENKTPPASDTVAPTTESAEPKAGRKRAEKVDGSPVTEATRLLIEAMYAYTGARDDDLAKALGVSRPQINNYRHGRSQLDPTPEQAEAMLALAREHANGLARAVQAFELETL